jgi:hypothetical protein
MINFGPNREEFEKGEPQCIRKMGNRGAMFHLDEDQAEAARKTQKLLAEGSGRLLDTKDAQGFIHDTINRIDRIFNQINTQGADELGYMRATLVEFQSQEPNEAMLKKLEKIHVRVLEIETQIYN